ncbi:SMI1/KNR4 family protein [Stenotrophomonas indicatrix]|uniref:SMI1/KNR4 family protein n=1 Tax=Stenotrophomonas indicatrix TaxID=2045451 RepID=UPI0010706B12|nr:SMI1/KNR4 family protein [Stenotrophomonas indicatrix]
MEQPAGFARSNVAFNDSSPGVPVELIAAMVPGRFPGRDDFIDFYSKNNGGYFDGGAVFYRDAFYEVIAGDYNRLEVEAFNYIEVAGMPTNPRLLSIAEVIESVHFYCPEMREFLETHIPFAGDCGDNKYWLDTQTGIVKFTVAEDEFHTDGMTVVAPDFPSFRANIQGMERCMRFSSGIA